MAAGKNRYEADQVVVAAGAYQRPRIPTFAAELDPDILQLHSSQYRDRSQLQAGGVLVVGAADSGAEIALEVSWDHRTWLSGWHPGQVPFRPQGWSGRLLLPVVWFLATYVLTVKTPIGWVVRRRVQVAGGRFARGLPLGRVRPKDLTAAGIQPMARTTGARGRRPVLEDGRALGVANVIWGTGFVPDFAWIELPVFVADGGPVHDRGIVGSEPGLSFVWDWPFPMRWRRRWSAGSPGTPTTSPSTSRPANPTAGPPSRWWPARDPKDQPALVSWVASCGLSWPGGGVVVAHRGPTPC